MSLYEELSQDVQELLEEFGQPMTFKTEDKSGGYDDSGNAQPAQPSVSVEGVGVKLSYSTNEKLALKSNSTAKILFHSDDVPQKGMFITLNSTVFRVVEIEPLEPAGVNVMYTLHVFG